MTHEVTYRDERGAIAAGAHSCACPRSVDHEARVYSPAYAAAMRLVTPAGAPADAPCGLCGIPGEFQWHRMVDAVLERLAAGEGRSAIAEEFNLTTKVVRRIHELMPIAALWGDAPDPLTDLAGRLDAAVTLSASPGHSGASHCSQARTGAPAPSASDVLGIVTSGHLELSGRLLAALAQALPIVEYVARGHSDFDRRDYPAVQARAVSAAIREVLGS